MKRPVTTGPDLPELWTLTREDQTLVMAKNPAPKIDEVSDLESVATPAKGMDLEGGLAFVTFAALLAERPLSDWRGLFGSTGASVSTASRRPR